MHLGSMGFLGPVLLLATVLYNVLFVATVSVAAVWPKNYLRAVELDANGGVVPSSVRDPAGHGRRERPGDGPCMGPHADGGGQGAVQQRQDAQDGRLGRVDAQLQGPRDQERC